MHLRIVLACLAAVYACSSSPKAASETLETPTAKPVATTVANVPTNQLVHEPQDVRRLLEHATFADLVHVATRLDDEAQPHSTAGCLLRGQGNLRLEADLSLAARPLPRPPERVVESIVDQAGSVNVMTTWGTIRGELSDAILVAFTTTSTNAVKVPAVALFATPSGVYVRGTDELLKPRTGALSPDEAATLLSQLTGAATVFVTADRDSDARSVLTLVRLIPNRFEVALAVAMPKGTRLPPSAADTREGLCPDGLPEPAANEAQGELSRPAAQSAVTPLREAALACALQAGGRALLGGRLALTLRIGADGRTREACFQSDEIHEPLLRRCLIGATRELALPKPAPPGSADLNIPLQLDLTGPPPQRASCD